MCQRSGENGERPSNTRRVNTLSVSTRGYANMHMAATG